MDNYLVHGTKLGIQCLRDYVKGQHLSSIAFFSSSQVDVVTNSPLCLAVYSFLAIRSSSSIRKRTLKLVALTYTLVASSKAARCLHMSKMITHSLTFVWYVWSSRVDTLRYCTTLCWDSSNEMLGISPSGWSPRILVPPWSLETFSSSRFGEARKLTSWWWCMRSMSCSNSYCSISVSNCWSACSISQVKSCSCDGSPCLPDANYSDESTTYMGVVSPVCTCCAPTVPIDDELPSPICAALVPFGVAPLTHATPSLFPPFSVSPSAFMQFTYFVVASSTL